MDKYYIKSEDWKKIYAFLKARREVRVGNEGKTRTFAEAVYFIMRTGAQWRELPIYFPFSLFNPYSCGIRRF